MGTRLDAVYDEAVAVAVELGAVESEADADDTFGQVLKRFRQALDEYALEAERARAAERKRRSRSRTRRGRRDNLRGRGAQEPTTKAEN